VTAKIAACQKWCGTRTGCLLEVVWYQNSSFFKVREGVAAELAAFWKRCNGRNVENGFALFSIGPAAIIFGATLPPATLPILATASAKRTNVAVRVNRNPLSYSRLHNLQNGYRPM
jgi:hypothetical protein